MQPNLTSIMDSSRMQVSCQKNMDDCFNGVDAITSRRIKQLQQDKLIAVHKEDYDEAKRIKVEIEKLREYDGEFGFSTTINRSTSEISVLSDVLIDGDEPHGKYAISISTNKVLRDNWTQTQEANSRVDIKFNWAQNQEVKSEIDTELENQCSNSSFEADSHSETHIDLTELPVQKKPVAETIYEIPSQFETIQIEASPLEEEIFTPEPLSEAALKEHGQLLSVIDQYYVECLMSKQWQLRDKALLHLEKKIQVKEVSEGSIAAFRSIHKALIRTINDKVSNVFHTALQVLRVFIKKYAPNVLNREIHSSATEITSALIEKLGHSNVRTREASSEALMFLAATKEIGLPVIAPLLLKAPKSQDMNKGDRTMCDPLQYSEIIPGDFPGQLEDMSLTNHKNDSAGTTGEITKDTFLQQSQPNSVQDSCELISPVMQHHGNSGRKLEETSIKKSPRIKQSMSIRASHESFSHLMRESLDGLKKDISIDSCIFCGLQDAEFTDGDKLDLHFCQRCPMLASCSNCRQIVEISTLKDHYLFECTTGKRYIECQKCLQAVPEVRTAAHLKSKECRPTKHPKITRCPLCNHAVKCSEAGWKDHLLKAPGCPKNPRNISAL